MQSPQHTYLGPGTYAVNLQVTDNKGCTNDTVQMVTVVPLPDINFTATPNPGCVDSPISFDGQSSGSITLWQWDFGDGGFSYDQDPVHSYTAAGTYTVSLSITDVFWRPKLHADGCLCTPFAHGIV